MDTMLPILMLGMRTFIDAFYGTTINSSSLMWENWTVRVTPDDGLDGNVLKTITIAIRVDDIFREHLQMHGL